VLEVSRASLEAQQLSMRVEALSAKVDFAERRARSIEGTLHQVRPSPRHEPGPPPAPVAQMPREPGTTDVAAAPSAQEGVTGEGGRRRRRRRRGRRPQGFTPEGAVLGAVAGAAVGDARLPDAGDAPDIDDVEEDEGGPDISDEPETFEPTASPVETVQLESEPLASPVDVTPPEEAVSPEPEPAPPDPTVDTPVDPAPADTPDRPFGD
jgi:hypothetical protein